MAREGNFCLSGIMSLSLEVGRRRQKWIGEIVGEIFCKAIEE